MLSPGTLLSERYELTERIAAGGMGEVWRGTDRMLHRAIAVKVVLPGLMADPEFLTRFRSEARMMAALRHPGIVQVYDYGENAQVGGGRMDYMVMEFIEGTPLSKQIQQAGRLSPAETMRIVAQVADALQVAHDAGIVHRDVKPANLLVRPNGALVLVDFGVARSTQVTGITSTNVVLGSANYMAPEQAEGHPVSGLTDVYALGAVAYCCLTGRPPYVGENPLQVLAQLVYGELPPLPPDVPPAVAALVNRALAKNPQHRFPSAAALAQAARGAGRPGAGPTVPYQRSGQPPANSGAFPPAGRAPASGAFPPAGRAPASGAFPPAGRAPATGAYPPGRAQSGAYGAPTGRAGAAAVPQAGQPGGTARYPGGTGAYPGGTGSYPGGTGSYPSGSASVPSSGGYAAGAASVSPPSYGNRPPAAVVTGGYEGGSSSSGGGNSSDGKKRGTVIAVAIAAVVLGVVAVTFAIVTSGSDNTSTDNTAANGAVDPGAGATPPPVEETTKAGKPKPAKTKTTEPTDEATQPVGEPSVPEEEETPADVTNPYTPTQLCGSDYKILETATLKGDAGTVGRVYLLVSGDKQQNCVVTLRSSDLNEKADASAFLEVQDKDRDTQDGEVDFYAGPVKAAAAKTCIKWGGSIDDFSYESDFGHCG
ncbi:protein kinase domain-containing protein [Paractinoplanes atraurantiacus]|uniref:non-specific serine/threonine protein kinase n=1 Tax=Paractinoplanes atraurantiacus TaxID=1036182 RepID=A0A285K131_9ACTN|nr:Serine/threonine protein kinase [Actinoplanes atraurantiacus]